MDYDPDPGDDDSVSQERELADGEYELLPEAVRDPLEKDVIDFLQNASSGQKKTVDEEDRFGYSPTVSYGDLPAAWLADRLPLEDISADQLAMIPEIYDGVDGIERIGPVLTAAFNMIDDDEMVYNAFTETTIKGLGRNLEEEKTMVIATRSGPGGSIVGQEAEGTLVNKGLLMADFGEWCDATVINYGQIGPGTNEPEDRYDMGSHNSGLTVNYGHTSALRRHGTTINFMDEPFYGWLDGLYINFGKPYQHRPEETQRIVYGTSGDLEISLSPEKIRENQELHELMQEYHDIFNPDKGYRTLLSDIEKEWDDPAKEIKNEIKQYLEGGL